MSPDCKHLNTETLWTETVYTIGENNRQEDKRSSIRKRCLDCEHEWTEERTDNES